MFHYLHNISTPSGKNQQQPVNFSLQNFRPRNSIDRDTLHDFRKKTFSSQQEAIDYAHRYQDAREQMMDLQVHEALCEMIMGGVAEQYYVKAKGKAERQNIYRQTVKKQFNTIAEQIKHLRTRSSYYEREILLPLISCDLPSFAHLYTNTGGVATGLRYEWMKKYESLIKELYMVALRMFQNAVHTDYDDTLAALTVVDVCCQICKLGGEQVWKSATRIMQNFSQVKKPDLRYADIIHTSVGTLSNMLAGHFNEKDLSEKKLTACVEKIDHALNYHKGILEKVATDTVNDYYRFYVAHIVRLMQQDKLEGTNRKLLRNDMKRLDPSGVLYMRCCKDWKWFATHLPHFDDIDDLKEAIVDSEYSPPAINQLFRIIMERRNGKTA